jgi:hypothetical protein
VAQEDPHRRRGTTDTEAAVKRASVNNQNTKAFKAAQQLRSRLKALQNSPQLQSRQL